MQSGSSASERTCSPEKYVNENAMRIEELYVYMKVLHIPKVYPQEFLLSSGFQFSKSIEI